MGFLNFITDPLNLFHKDTLANKLHDPLGILGEDPREPDIPGDGINTENDLLYLVNPYLDDLSKLDSVSTSRDNLRIELKGDAARARARKSGSLKVNTKPKAHPLTIGEG